MKTILIKFVAARLAGIGGSGFDRVVEWVVDVSSEKLEGWQKAEIVIGMFSGKWQLVASFIARTVVQLAYAYAKLKNLFPEEEA